MSQELLDFCSGGLCQSISASSATSDGFEAENLLSPASRGFLAAGFVRPPVTLTLEFCCPVELRQVRICLRLSQQHTTSVQLLVAGPGSDDWQPAGSLWEQHGQPPPDEVSFVNGAACGGRGGSGPPPAALRLPLRCRDRAALRRVARLRVRLTRARGPSALCLSSLRVWAVAAEPSHPALRAALSQRAAAAAASTPSQPAPAASPQSGEQRLARERESRAAAARAAVERTGPTPPEEFVDPITCEVMLLPMVLPSGQTVDRSTLERHERAEAGWGRPPSDPFSGVPFGGGARPVPDAALKARIDHFLFEHAGAAPELAAVGRTVGRAKRPASPTPPTAPPAQRAAYDPRAAHPGPGSDRAAGGTSAGDLDTALRSALSGLKSFQPRPAAPTAPVCGCGAERNLYSLPCTHAACRACLLRLPKAAECGTCRKTFQKADAVRLHT
ncbi:RING finger protein 37 [Amphibalanus amphitrite]|uniref:RING finger protein 37 n=1 Tax=Amphibalanus amphitrite TaxID=1232801 RepID=A0A6A4W137_AMPAM|nr:RING finger protein 37 [Amphibalanus amphitrite]